MRKPATISLVMSVQVSCGHRQRFRVDLP